MFKQIRFQSNDVFFSQLILNELIHRLVSITYFNIVKTMNHEIGNSILNLGSRWTIKRAIVVCDRAFVWLFSFFLHRAWRENESENRRINIINLAFCRYKRKQIIRFDWISLGMQKNGNSIRVNGVPICARLYIYLLMCSCLFYFLFFILICFTSNTIFVQFIMTRCLFCFNKLPQNEFTITCSIFKCNHFTGGTPEQEMDKYQPIWKKIFYRILYWVFKLLKIAFFAIESDYKWNAPSLNICTVK